MTLPYSTCLLHYTPKYKQIFHNISSVSPHSEPSILHHHAGAADDNTANNRDSGADGSHINNNKDNNNSLNGTHHKKNSAPAAAANNDDDTGGTDNSNSNISTPISKLFHRYFLGPYRRRQDSGCNESHHDDDQGNNNDNNNLSSNISSTSLQQDATQQELQQPNPTTTTTTTTNPASSPSSPSLSNDIPRLIDTDTMVPFTTASDDDDDNHSDTSFLEKDLLDADYVVPNDDDEQQYAEGNQNADTTTTLASSSTLLQNTYARLEEAVQKNTCIPDPVHLLSYIFTYIPFSEYGILQVTCPLFQDALKIVDWNLFLPPVSFLPESMLAEDEVMQRKQISTTTTAHGEEPTNGQNAPPILYQPLKYLTRYMENVTSSAASTGSETTPTLLYPSTTQHLTTESHSQFTKSAFKHLRRHNALLIRVCGAYVPRRLSQHMNYAWDYANKSRIQRLQNPFHEIVSWRAEKKRLRDKLNASLQNQPAKKRRRKDTTPVTPVTIHPQTPQISIQYHKDSKFAFGEATTAMTFYSREELDEKELAELQQNADSAQGATREGEYEVEKVLEYRKGLGYLVRWKGYSDDSNTWEPLSNLNHATKAVEEFHRAQGILNRHKFKNNPHRRIPQSGLLEEAVRTQTTYQEERNRLKNLLLNELNRSKQLHLLNDFVRDPTRSRVTVKELDGRTWEGILKNSSHLFTDFMRNQGRMHVAAMPNRERPLCEKDLQSAAAASDGKVPAQAEPYHMGQLETSEIVQHTRAAYLRYSGNIREEARLREEERLKMMEEYLSTANTLDLYDEHGALKSLS